MVEIALLWGKIEQNVVIKDIFLQFVPILIHQLTNRNQIS